MSTRIDFPTDKFSADNLFVAGGEVPKKDAWRTLLRESGYLLLGFPMALLFFLVAVMGLSIGGATVVIWIGLPVMAATFGAVEAFTNIERTVVSSLLGRDIPRPKYEHSESGLRGWLTTISDSQRWFDVIWVLTYFCCSVLTFSLTAALWVGAAYVFLGPFAELILHLQGFQEGIWGMPAWLVNSVEYLLAVGCLILLPRGVSALASMQAALSNALLGMRANYEAQVDQLNRSRQAAREAEAQSLHRLERDIHDGPQQRLIRLQMDLARAERAAASDPQKARELLSQAKEQTSLTLAELRNLSRGIAPPVLQDRGLAAALDDLAARSDIACSVSVDGVDEGAAASQHALATAYFVAAEAVANANKHSGATRIDINVASDGQELVVTVRDDGEGGASLAKGHGLAGLRQRLNGIDGSLRLDSPDGGPTVVQAVMPCGS